MLADQHHFPLGNNTKVWKSQKTSQDHNTLEKMSSFVSRSVKMVTDTFPMCKQWINRAQLLTPCAIAMSNLVKKEKLSTKD